MQNIQNCCLERLRIGDVCSEGRSKKPLYNLTPAEAVIQRFR